MIAAMVSAILLIVLALITAWLAFPAFRTWSERPKYRMLERNARYDSAHPENTQSLIHCKNQRSSTPKAGDQNERRSCSLSLPDSEVTPKEGLIKTVAGESARTHRRVNTFQL